VDGPSGAGKSIIVHHLAQMLVAAGEQAHVTAEPSAGPVGQLCRELTETVTGHATACLYAADRYHHVETVDGVERRSIVSHFNKATKGRLVRALLTAGAAPRTPEALAAALRDLGFTVEADGPRLDVLTSDLH
jgi:hypothetical protein